MGWMSLNEGDLSKEQISLLTVGLGDLELDRSTNLLVDLAANDRDEYVEERSIEIEDLEEEFPHNFRMSAKLLPTKLSYSWMPSSSQRIFILWFGILAPSEDHGEGE